VREGTDVTVVAYSVMVRHGAAAAEILAGRGISVELVDLRSLVPLDLDTVAASVVHTGRAVVAHEAWRTGGFGAEVAARLSEELWGDLDAPVVRVGARSVAIPFSPVLERAVVPGVEEVVAAVEQVLAY